MEVGPCTRRRGTAARRGLLRDYGLENVKQVDFSKSSALTHEIKADSHGAGLNG